MQKQRGMTLIGTLLTVIAIVMAAIVIMRIIPVYIRYYEIIESVKSLNSTPATSFTGDPVEDVTVLRQGLQRRLNINGIEDFKDSNVTFTQDGTNKYKVVVKYQEVRPLVFNMSILFDFNDTIEVTTGSED